MTWLLNAPITKLILANINSLFQYLKKQTSIWDRQVLNIDSISRS